MAQDAKYGKVTAERGDRVHGKPGVPLNESDEPCFVLRAQDRLSVEILEDYRRHYTQRILIEHQTLDETFIASLDEVIATFIDWQDRNPGYVKFPD